jgi:endonuclease-8
MPEGDTLWRTAAAIRDWVGGLKCTRARPDELQRLEGQTLVAVDSYGKHLFMEFSSGISLHSHMRMNGSWHLYRSGQPWKKPAWQAKAELAFGDHIAVVFSAPIVELVRGQGKVAHLGPDILADPFDLHRVLANARATDAPTVGELLLDQQVCAGVGNIYKCESLWELRIDPWTNPSEIDNMTMRKLYEVARRKMRQAAGSGAIR